MFSRNAFVSTVDKLQQGKTEGPQTRLEAQDSQHVAARNTSCES